MKFVSVLKITDTEMRWLCYRQKCFCFAEHWLILGGTESSGFCNGYTNHTHKISDSLITSYLFQNSDIGNKKFVNCWLLLS